MATFRQSLQVGHQVPAILCKVKFSGDMTTIELTAPAKVNLVLRILNKRKDSYHNIFTIFERISLSDRIKISRIPKGIVVSCDKDVTSRPEDNIAYKAADLILNAYKIDEGVKIHIKKRIPIAAGLGGGSSDAAAVLVGINKLFNLNASKDRLMRLGAKLGADVPFFVYDTPFAIGRGIGDRLKKLNISGRAHHLLVYPGFKVATKDVYRVLDTSKLTNSRSNMKDLKSLTKIRGDDKIPLSKNWDKIKNLSHNDLESVVVAKRPVIGKIIRCLGSSPDGGAMVSGSGPSVFCLCRNRREAMEAKKRLFASVPERVRASWQVFLVETKA